MMDVHQCNDETLRPVMSSSKMLKLARSLHYTDHTSQMYQNTGLVVKLGLQGLSTIYIYIYSHLVHVSAFLTPSIQHFARLVHDALKCDSGVSKKRKPCQHSVILVSISLDFCSTLVCQCRHTIPLTFETPKACIQYLEIICVGILKLIG